jgi:GNAT superfamily N-acetyltransferase
VSDFDIRELPPAETGLAFAAMLALRPHVTTLEEFVDRVNHRQRPQGYRLVAALPPGGGPAAAVAGFRLIHNLVSGAHLYVDDLSTAPEARRRGLAGALMAWLRDEAARLGCGSLQLDSAVGPERTDAHRLYFNQGLAIAAFHFVTAL